MPIRNLIIDSDFGIDDATSVIACLAHQSTNVKAITVVDGNVGVDRGFENCEIILNLLKKTSIPVFKGAAVPIVPGLIEKVCWPGHAVDGLGGFTLAEEWKSFTAKHLPNLSPITVSSEPAASALVRLVKENPALGPLTNIAIAILLDPTFLQNLQRLVVMGGCLNARGNSNRVAEFNFHCDPEAVHIVLQASSALSRLRPDRPPLVEIVPWETTVEHGIPWTFYDGIVASDEALPAFLRGYVKTAEMLGRKGQNGVVKKVGMRTVVENHLLQINTFLMCDIYAAIAFLEPKSVQSSQEWDVKIELGGTHSRGLLALEWFGTPGASNARIVTSIDREMVRSLYEKTFCGA
ncbi:Envelope glycoprotein [Phlyctochytrium planicorne]|nr:Envelope glycoprotein [Phlyctochytrium planicorne]